MVTGFPHFWACEAKSPPHHGHQAEWGRGWGPFKPTELGPVRPTSFLWTYEWINPLTRSELLWSIHLPPLNTAALGQSLQHMSFFWGGRFKDSNNHTVCFWDIKFCDQWDIKDLIFNSYLLVSKYLNWAWWYIPGISTFRRLRQEDRKTGSLRPVWATQQDLISK